MIGGIILTGTLLAIVILVISFGTAFFLSVFIGEVIERLGKYWDMKKIFCTAVCLVLTYLFYNELTDWVLMIFE